MNYMKRHPYMIELRPQLLTITKRQLLELKTTFSLSDQQSLVTLISKIGTRGSWVRPGIGSRAVRRSLLFCRLPCSFLFSSLSCRCLLCCIRCRLSSRRLLRCICCRLLSRHLLSCCLLRCCLLRCDLIWVRCGGQRGRRAWSRRKAVITDDVTTSIIGGRLLRRRRLTILRRIARVGRSALISPINIQRLGLRGVTIIGIVGIVRIVGIHIESEEGNWKGTDKELKRDRGLTNR